VVTMSEAMLTLDRKYFSDIPSSRRLSGIKSRDLPTLASKLDLLADIIEVNWSQLPSPVKELAKTYAYYEIENGVQTSFFDRLRFALFMFRNITAKEDVAHLFSSIARLTDAVFSAVERENVNFNERLEEALDSPTSTEPMTVEQFRAWTRSL
jgi:hypothetical protein